MYLIFVDWKMEDCIVMYLYPMYRRGSLNIQFCTPLNFALPFLIISHAHTPTKRNDVTDHLVNAHTYKYTFI